MIIKEPVPLQILRLYTMRIRHQSHLGWSPSEQMLTCYHRLRVKGQRLYHKPHAAQIHCLWDDGLAEWNDDLPHGMVLLVTATGVTLGGD